MKQPKSLMLAYGNKKSPKECAMCRGGSCDAHPQKMAEGGEVMTSDEKKASVSKSFKDSMGMGHPHDLEEHVDLVSDILKDRKRMKMMAEGGEVESEVDEPAFAQRIDLEPVHTIPDPAHDQESPSEDDMDLVGQIIRDRKSRRR